MTLRICGRVRRLVVAGALAALLLPPLPGASAAPPYNPNDPVQAAEYHRALSLGVQAYVYGYPLLDTDRVFRTSTSGNAPDGAGGGPINQFNHFRRFTSPADKTVVAPNRDTLYSIAWLNLRPQPIVVHMPVVKGRFVVFELVDPYTENFANVGSVGRPPGDYAVVPPGWRGRLPHGLKEIRSPYTRVWVIGRTYIKSAADTANVVRIQNEYSLTPLGKWGTAYRPSRPRHVVKRPTQFKVPGTVPSSDPLAFFDALGDQLKQFPPPRADGPLLGQLADVGIGPGMHPSSDPRLDAATLAGLRASVAAGGQQVSSDVQRKFLTTAPKRHGWLVAITGRYGTDYKTRAVVDLIGLGAPVSSLAIYPFTITDANIHPLNGANRYVAHFSPRYLPFPVKAFWSLTMYDSHGFFVPNSAGIYLLNNRSHLRYNHDGSLDMYIQPDPPTNRAQRRNWLPSPAGAAFRLIMRLYKPADVTGIVSGRTWQPPTVLPCLANGMTSAGTACAR
jgi:DNA sulfur modification protein DndE